MAYDDRCHYLAGIFLGDEPHLHNARRIDELAQIIQDAIERYIEAELHAND